MKKMVIISFLFHFFAESFNTIKDAIYILLVGGGFFHYHIIVSLFMCVSSITALIKDVFCCRWLINAFHGTNGIKPNSKDRALLNVKTRRIALLGEDLIQTFFQYFFIEKFARSKYHGFIIFNSIYMLGRSLYHIVVIQPILNLNKQLLLVIPAILLPLIVQVARLAGVLRYILVVSPKVNGACLNYDYSSAEIQVYLWNKGFKV